MKVVKIKLKQNQAHYKKEETSKNKMTYPLPPLSTVIGAIHNACGYTEYHPMNVSIQGKYKSMYKRPYTDYCFLNSVMDDRGVLVKFPNDKMMSRAYTRVGTAKKSQGNSFRKQITIDVHSKELMGEYIALKDLGDEIAKYKKEKIDKFKKLVKDRKKTLTAKKKTFDKKSEEFEKIAKREKEVKAIEKLVGERLKEYTQINYTNEINKYASLTTSLKYYEILTDVELVLHIEAEDSVLKDIMNNTYNLRAIGRSEDGLEIIGEPKMVKLVKTGDDVTSKYSSYLSKEKVINDQYDIRDNNSQGTSYRLNKKYDIKNGKRIFEKVNVLYTSNHSIDEDSEDIFIDEENLIVDLL